jgi:hypothetical protein
LILLLLTNPYKFLQCYFCAFWNMAAFHVPTRSNLTIMVNDSKTMVVSKHVCALCLFFSSILYIYLKTFRMITLFQIFCTRFLRPLCKGDNGWLAMVVIALLVIAWFIIIKKPSLW